MLKMFSLIIVQVLLSLGGLYKIKTAQDYFSIGFWAGFGFYAVSFFLWVYILRGYAISVVFPVATALSIVCSQLVGIFLLNEGYSGFQAAAVILIIGGVALLAYSK